MGDRKQPTPVPDGAIKPPPPPAPPTPRRIFGSGFQEPSINEKIEAGDDETTRREKAMGLDIDKRTGRAYQSQGDAANLNSGVGGRFHDGIMLPRAFQCDACNTVVYEREWRSGFQNCAEVIINPGRYVFQRCGSINLGPGGRFNLCGDCVEKAIRAVPNLAAICSAMNGGTVHRRG